MSKLITLDNNSESIKYLCGRDRRFAKVFSMVGPISYKPYDDSPYAFMVHEIIEQMLSQRQVLRFTAGLKIYAAGMYVLKR